MSLTRRLGLLLFVAPRVSTAAPAVFNANVIRCDEIQAKVERAGYVNLSTINEYIYDRYVADGRFCERGQVAEPAFVATGDSPQCLVGYRCQAAESRD